MKETIQRISLVLFGIIIFLIVSEFVLQFCGLIAVSSQNHLQCISKKQKKTFNILCLGESTTAMGGKDSYPSQLQEILNQRAVGVKFRVINLGRGGVSTSNIIKLVENLPQGIVPDIVLTMMGINDHIEYMPYQRFQSENEGSFWMRSKVFKLANLLWLKIAVRLDNESIRSGGVNSRSKKEALSVNDYQVYLTSGYKYHEEGKEIPAEEDFRAALKLNPAADEAYVGLGWSLRSRRKIPESKQSFLEAIRINPMNFNAYRGLGWCYMDQVNYAQAEEAFKKAIEIKPLDSEAFRALGCAYKEETKYSLAEEAFNKAIQLNPKDDRAYLDLGWCYRDQGKSEQSIDFFKKAIELNPQNDNAYSGMGWSYKDLRKFAEYESAFKKSLELKPKKNWTYLEIGYQLWSSGNYAEAEKIIKQAIEIDPFSDFSYGALATLYQEMRRHDLAENCYDQADHIRAGYFNPITTNNYLKLKEILDKRGIKWICVQYPVRGLEPIKKIFAGKSENIIFVDNSRIFRDAIKASSYRDYFTDMFGGDFGHCTPRGNKLLAENIADTVLKEYFNK